MEFLFSCKIGSYISVKILIVESNYLLIVLLMSLLDSVRTKEFILKYIKEIIMMNWIL